MPYPSVSERQIFLSDTDFGCISWEHSLSGEVKMKMEASRGGRKETGQKKKKKNKKK